MYLDVYPFSFLLIFLIKKNIFLMNYLFLYNFCRKCKNVVKKMKTEVIQKVAFRTQSELEIMDDGYKWRKYGKKSVKNSPNPR